MTSPGDEGMDRREFLTRAAGAGLLALGVGAGSLWLHDATGEQSRPGRGEGLVLPNYALADEDAVAEVAVATGSQRAASLGRALRMLGGLERFVKPGEAVLLKVNAAFATPAALSATSHPDLVYEMARLCFAVGASRVTVTDNPINDPRSAFEVSGIAGAARRAGAELLIPRPEDFSRMTVPGAKLLRAWPILADPLLQHDRVIGMAPVKDHHRAGASMSIKNWYGLLGGRRNVFHQDVNAVIRDLSIMLRPTFVILDGTTTMQHNGPTGGALSDLSANNTLIVGTDQVAVDVLGAELLGRTTAELPYLGMAAEAGAGSASLDAVRVLRERGDA